MRHTARRLSLPVVENPCPANGNTKRQEIKELIYELQGRYHGLKSRVFGSMQRLPLPEWGPVEHRHRPTRLPLRYSPVSRTASFFT